MSILAERWLSVSHWWSPQSSIDFVDFQLCTQKSHCKWVTYSLSLSYHMELLGLDGLHPNAGVPGTLDESTQGLKHDWTSYRAQRKLYCSVDLVWAGESSKEQDGLSRRQNSSWPKVRPPLPGFQRPSCPVDQFCWDFLSWRHNQRCRGSCLLGSQFSAKLQFTVSWLQKDASVGRACWKYLGEENSQQPGKAKCLQFRTTSEYQHPAPGASSCQGHWSPGSLKA